MFFPEPVPFFRRRLISNAVVSSKHAYLVPPASSSARPREKNILIIDAKIRVK